MSFHAISITILLLLIDALCYNHQTIITTIAKLVELGYEYQLNKNLQFWIKFHQIHH